MDRNEALTQARYIFTTGRMIHDRITRICTVAGMHLNANSPLAELSSPQMNMLMVIRVREAVSVGELAALLGVSPPSVSAMVERLVERGILTRIPSETDRRKVVIRLAPHVISDIARVEEMVLGSFVELVEAVGSETTAKWCEVLQHVRQVLDSAPPPPGRGPACQEG